MSQLSSVFVISTPLTDIHEIIYPPLYSTRIPVILDHENATAKIESVKTLYPVLYDYSYFRKECFWEKQAKNTF